jgi:hypothetical protein
VLGGLAKSSPENQALVVAGGAIPVLVAALQNHTNGSDAKCVTSACSTLITIVTGSADNQARVASAGGLSCVVAAIMPLIDDSSAIESLCRALACLIASNSSNSLLSLRAGAIPNLCNVMIVHSLDEDIIPEAAKAMASLSEHCADMIPDAAETWDAVSDAIAALEAAVHTEESIVSEDSSEVGDADAEDVSDTDEPEATGDSDTETDGDSDGETDGDFGALASLRGALTVFRAVSGMKRLPALAD